MGEWARVAITLFEGTSYDGEIELLHVMGPMWHNNEFKSLSLTAIELKNLTDSRDLRGDSVWDNLEATRRLRPAFYVTHASAVLTFSEISPPWLGDAKAHIVVNDAS